MSLVNLPRDPGTLKSTRPEQSLGVFGPGKTGRIADCRFSAGFYWSSFWSSSHLAKDLTEVSEKASGSPPFDELWKQFLAPS